LAGILRTMSRSMQQVAVKFYLKSLTAGGMLPVTQSGKPIYTDWSGDKAIKEGYKASTYVYKSIERKAAAAASVPWKVYKLKNNKWELQEGHPIEALIEQPNPFMDRAVMIERLTAHLDLVGNGLLSKVRGVGGIVAELWPIEPQYIKPIPNKQDFISGYEFKKGQIKEILKPQDVLHAMYVDPGNIYWGMAPLQVAAKTVDTDTEAVNWNKIALQNRAVTDGVLSYEAPLSRPQWEEARAQVREQKQGAANARDLWILGGGAKWQQMSLSPAEMDFINSRKMTREEITAIFGVPLILMGILEGSTYANYQEARKAFWEDTVIPYLNRIRAIFNQSLLPDFQSKGEVLYIDYDLSNVPALQENFKEKVESAKGLWSMGVPFNMINQRLELGFDEVEGGETGFIGSGLIPANIDFNSLAMDPGGAATDPGKDDDEGKSKGAAAALQTKEAKQLAFAVKGINLQGEEQKALYWKSQERRRLAWYAKFTKAAGSKFKTEGKAIAAAYENGGSKAALKAITKQDNQKEWAKLFLRHYKGIVKEFGQSAFNNLKSSGPSETKEELTFDPYDEIIQQYLITHAAEKVAGVLEFTKQIIAAIILDLEKEGANVDQVARSIRKQFDDMSINRAFRIARTETSAASNYGLFQAGKQSGVAVKKIWINSSDDRVRDSHDFKEAVEMDDKFKNGLLYPGDMASGKAKEVIHCRCTLAYETE
jgi:HK97 family phage portal protein